MDLEPLLRESLRGLLRELVDGPKGDMQFVINPGDPGLLGSLGRLSAADASAQPDGRPSVAAHVDHVRFGLNVLNRWYAGESPFADADFAASWKKNQVNQEQWRQALDALRQEAQAWIDSFDKPRDWDPVTLGAAIGSVAHIAYHLGAIRQIVRSASGPRER